MGRLRPPSGQEVSGNSTAPVVRRLPRSATGIFDPFEREVVITEDAHSPVRELTPNHVLDRLIREAERVLTHARRRGEGRAIVY